MPVRISFCFLHKLLLHPTGALQREAEIAAERAAVVMRRVSPDTRFAAALNASSLESRGATGPFGVEPKSQDRRRRGLTHCRRLWCTCGGGGGVGDCSENEGSLLWRVLTGSVVGVAANGLGSRGTGW